MKDNITQLQAKPQGDDDHLHAAHLMERMGGSFAASIARAYYCADSYNKERLKAAFPDLFTRYFNEYLRDQANPLTTVSTPNGTAFILHTRDDN